MKNKISTLIILLSFSICYCQKEITWQDLSKVKFTVKYFPEYDDYFKYPEFSSSVKALEGKLITIEGYFLNIDPNEKLFVLSKGPMSSCFFCGVGGPETAIEVQFKNKPSFKTDNIVAITGTLKLNKDDVEHFNYILTDCKGILIE
ncbi:hypothetical protein UMM65_03420 [Aureibaculum sp. 2210JD6-5]|uniref:hypothetical protein n=1 Tax=Aureibaculum sp. 2210JD6-5 TaxID=3103957 RepID=UPI002AAEF893|nr:hypothetical protein [Aureibaculum sp. 2210JD6-5]MDY7394276.1 hypothetical protein [Aureibaculum sp. 2210JD6-5]